MSTPDFLPLPAKPTQKHVDTFFFALAHAQVCLAQLKAAKAEADKQAHRAADLSKIYWVANDELREAGRALGINAEVYWPAEAA